MRVRGWGPECEGDGEGKGVRVRGTLSMRNEECGVLVVSRVRSGDRLHDASGIGCGAVRTGVGLGLWARVGLGLGLGIGHVWLWASGGSCGACMCWCMCCMRATCEVSCVQGAVMGARFNVRGLN